MKKYKVTVNGNVYRIKMVQQAKLNAKPNKLIMVYALLRLRKRMAYVNVFMSF